MRLIRLLLIVLMTLTTSVSGAMGADHATAMDHAHANTVDVAGDDTVCCSDSTERTQSCHVLPALVPASDLRVTGPTSCRDVSFGPGLLLTGIEPSRPLDPPLSV